MIVSVIVDVVIIKYLVVVVVIMNLFIVVIIVIIIIIIIIIIKDGLDSLKILIRFFPLSFIIRSFKDLFDSLIYQDLNSKNTTIAFRIILEAQTSKSFLILSTLIYLFYPN